MKTAATVWMVAFLIWLPIEDTQIWASAALALTACIWLALRLRPDDVNKLKWPQLLGSGALAGAAVPILTIILMAFKSGLHAHGFADFTVRQLWTIFNSIPFTIVIGLIVAVLLKLLSDKLTRNNI